MDTLEQIATSLKLKKEEQKAFKKENKEIFKQNTLFNKEVRALADELAAKMSEQGVMTYEHNGMEFNIKKKTTQKHDMEKLSELMESDQYEEYIGNVQVEKTEVTTRNSNSKRPRTS